MSNANNIVSSGVAICLLFFFVMFLLPGCMAVSALKGKPGLDVNSVMVGMNKAEVKKILGSPVREWTVSSGIVYCVYDYDAGLPPSGGDAAAHVLMDIISVGAWELFGAFGQLPDIRNREQIAVSYDVNGILIDVFDRFGDFDVLPSDTDGHGN